MIFRRIIAATIVIVVCLVKSALKTMFKTILFKVVGLPVIDVHPIYSQKPNCY